MRDNVQHQSIAALVSANLPRRDKTS